MDSPLLLGSIAAIFLLAGFVKGVLGLGLPTVAIGLLGLFMSPAQALVLLAFPTLTTNIWQLFAGPSLGALLKRLWPMLLGIFVGAYLGRNLLVGNSNGTATAMLGAVLVIYSLLNLTAVKFSVPRGAEPWLTPVIGLANGVISAASGLFAIPSMPYMQALGLDKDDLVQALGLSFTASMIAMTVILSRAGAFQTSVALPSAIALLSAFAGMFIGQRVRTLLPTETFRTCFLIGMLLLGAHLALGAIL